MMDDGTKISESAKRYTPSPTTNSESGNEELNNTRITINQPSDAEEAKLMKDLTDDERSVIAESLDSSETSDVTEKGVWSEGKVLPSLEITHHTDCKDDDKISDTESGINLLSAIIEENSPDSSTSELIDTKVTVTVDNEKKEEILENLANADTSSTMALEATHDTAAAGCVETQEERSQAEGKADENDKIITDNEILTSRIEEINEQLAKAKNEISDLRKSLAEYEGDDEHKNPGILLNKLSVQKVENDNLKQQVVQQTEMIDSAAATQLELSKRVERLMAEGEAKTEKINQKQEEVEKLEIKVAKLASVIQSMTTDREDDNGSVNGSVPVTGITTSKMNSTSSLERPSISHTYSRHKKRSKICIVL